MADLFAEMKESGVAGIEITGDVITYTPRTGTTYTERLDLK
jgi:hypothetical protein